MFDVKLISRFLFSLDMDDNWNGAILPLFRQTFHVYVWVEISDHPAATDGSTHYVDLSVQIADVIVSGGQGGTKYIC